MIYIVKTLVELLLEDHFGSFSHKIIRKPALK
jgi:hypothetical protein